MLVSEFDFELPGDRIAQVPSMERDQARLLVLERASGRLRHQRMTDLPGLLAPGDLLVVNDTRVFPARLLGRRGPSGDTVECLLLTRLNDENWDALVSPGRKLRVGVVLLDDHGEVVVNIHALCESIASCEKADKRAAPTKGADTGCGQES